MMAASICEPIVNPIAIIVNPAGAHRPSNGTRAGIGLCSTFLKVGLLLAVGVWNNFQLPTTRPAAISSN